MSKRTPAPKPAHYKVICVSFYTDDMARLDAAVAVFHGAGGNFCAGADLKAVARGDIKIAQPGEDGPAGMGPTRLLLGKPVIAAVDGPEYREFNFSPAGQWAAYRFLTCRERDAGFVPPAIPESSFQRHADGFQLTAQIAPELLPPASTFHIGLSAVIEAADAPVVLETPAPGIPDDLAYLRESR